VSIDISTQAFARHHAITYQQAERYAQGRQDRRDGITLRPSERISHEDAWYRAGWHDADMEVPA